MAGLFDDLLPQQQAGGGGLFDDLIPKETGGFVASAKQAIGSVIRGAGQAAADVIPGVGKDNAVKRYGQEVIDANPTAVNSLEDIADRPGKAVTEATGNAAGSIGGMLGARAVGQGVTALAPFAGPGAPVVAAIGQAISWLGPAAMAALPSYGGIRDKQILNDPAAEDDAKSKAVAALGAAAVGAIETKFGPQQWALSAMTNEGRAALAEKFAETTLGRGIAFGMLKGAGVEGAEELVQNPIEQVAAGDNPTTPQSLRETAFGGAMGAIGGGVLGGGFGAGSNFGRKPQPDPEPDPVPEILNAPDVDTAIASARDATRERAATLLDRQAEGDPLRNAMEERKGPVRSTSAILNSAALIGAQPVDPLQTALREGGPQFPSEPTASTGADVGDLLTRQGDPLQPMVQDRIARGEDFRAAELERQTELDAIQQDAASQNLTTEGRGERQRALERAADLQGPTALELALQRARIAPAPSEQPAQADAATDPTRGADASTTEGRSTTSAAPPVESDSTRQADEPPTVPRAPDLIPLPRRLAEQRAEATGGTVVRFPNLDKATGEPNGKYAYAVLKADDERLSPGPGPVPGDAPAGRVLDAGTGVDTGAGVRAPANAALAPGDAGIERAGQPLASGAGRPAAVEPVETWFGRAGNGYQTKPDAEMAIQGRKRAMPDLSWKVEALPNGRFRLAGYAPQGGQLGDETSQPQAVQAGASQVAGAAGPGDSSGAGQRADVALPSVPDIAPVPGSAQRSGDPGPVRPAVTPLTRAAGIEAGPAVVLQNRDRSSAASIAQMNEIAASPDYLRAGPARVMETGAPVAFGDIPATATVGRTEQIADGKGQRVSVQYAAVEATDVLASNSADGSAIPEYAQGVPGKMRAVAGNGRAAGIAEAYRRGTATQYRADLESDAQALGLDPAAIQGMKAPVLVRVMAAKDVTPDIGDRSNIAGTARLSAVEQAGTDARRIDLAALEFAEDGEPTAQAVTMFTAGMPTAERGELINRDGTPTRQAIDRLMAATFKQAYGSDELVRLYAQATDSEARTIMTALADSAGAMASLQGAGELDIRGAVAEAAGIAVNARRRGQKLADVLQNADMTMSGEAFEIARFFADNIRSAKKISEGLRNWAAEASEQARIARDNEVQGGMFGETPVLSREQLFARIGDGQEAARQGRVEQPAGQGDAGERAARGQDDPGTAEAGAAAGPQQEGLVAPTPADVLAQQDRRDDADTLDQREQIDREASAQTLTSQTAPEQRRDDSGDMFAREKAEAEIAKRNEGRAQEADPDQGTMFARGAKAEAPSLIIQHNLSIENLLHAQRLGGIPVPSLAITKADQGLTGFGEITLLGDGGMATPKTDTKVFGADIYSPRYPSVQYKPDSASLKRIRAVLEPFRKEGDYGLSELRTLDDLTGDKAFVRYADSKHGGSASYAQMKMEATKLALEAGAEERIFQGFTYSGNRRYKAHTLDNVIAILKKELRGGENFNYGAGSLRAKFTPQFRSIAQIRASKDRLITKDAFEKIKDEINKELLDLTYDMVPNAGFRSSDTGMAILEDGAKMGMRRAAKEYDIELTDDQVQRANDFLSKLRNLPTQYFEAKVLRAMDVSEFKVAVVPDNIPAEARKVLEDKGLQITTYPKGDDAARTRAVEQASLDADVRFSRGPTRAPGLTLNAFNNAIEQAFGKGVGRRLMDRGVVIPLEDQTKLPAHVVPFVRDDDRIFGFYDPKTDRTYAVLANLTPEMVKGLVIHEVGVHYGFESMLGKDKYNQVIERIKMLGKAGDKAVKEASKTAIDSFGVGGLPGVRVGEGVYRYAHPARDVSAANAAINKLLDEGEVVLGSSVGRRVAPGMNQELGNAGLRATNQLADLLVREPAIAQRLSTLDVKTQRMVLSLVRSAVNDSKVFDSIVEFVPIDVVDMLKSGQLSSKAALDNGAMLSNLLSVDKDSPVALSINVAGRIAETMTRAARFRAEVALGSDDVWAAPKKFNATFETLAGNQFIAPGLRMFVKDHTLREEELAYLVMNHPETTLVKEVIAKIRAWLFDKFGIGGKNLTLDDITALARAAVLHSSRSEPGMRRPDFVTAKSAFARRFSSLPGKRPTSSYVDATPRQQATLDRMDDGPEGSDYQLLPARESLQVSADSHFTDWEKEPGIKYVALDSLGLTGYDNDKDTARIRRLADDIKESGEIEPIFVGIDPNGEEYVMEGQHRARAMKMLGETHIPAQVVVSMEGEDGDYDALPEPVNAGPTDYKAAPGQMPMFARSLVTGQPLPQAWQGPGESKLDDLLYSLQDKHIDTKRTVQAIRQTIGQIADEQDPYLQEELYHGRASKEVKDFLNDDIKPLLVDLQMRGIELSDFEEYLHNRHAEKRNVQVAKVNPAMPDGGSGIKTADAQAYLAGLPQAKRTAYQALARRVDAINRDTRALLVSSGLEKQDTIDAWQNAYGDEYVPLMREEMDAGKLGIGQGFSVRGSASKRAMGSDKPVANILANIALQREKTITRVEKQKIGQALYALVLQSPNPDFWTAIDPALEQDPAQITATAMQLISMGLNPQDAESIAAEPKERYIGKDNLVHERINPALRSADNALAVRIDGEDKYVFFNARDPRAMRMATSLKNLDADQLGAVMSATAKVTRYFASINTQYNPIFGITNITRDIQGALLNLSSTPLAGKQADVMKHVLPALRGIYIDLRDHRAGKAPTSSYAQIFEEFQKEGGATGFRDMYANAQERADAIADELKAIKDGKLMQAGKGIMAWLSDYNESMENAVRVAAYKVGKEQGLSAQQAASIAKNLTVNFNRKGQVALQAGALYAFFNASVQGTARLAETLLQGGKLSAAGRKIITGGLLLGTMQALALAAAGYDDEEPPDFVRERSLVLPVGGDKYVSIPMPLGFHVIPNLARIPTEWALGGFKNTPKRIGQLVGIFAGAFNPIGSAGLSLQTLTPTIIDPLAALAENKDFTGKSIAKKDFDAMRPTAGHTRAKDTATPWARMISEAVNYATGGSEYKAGLASPTPDQIDYLIGQITGGLGREVGKISQVASGTASGEEVPLYKVPLVGRFIGSTEGQAAQASRYYDNLREIGGHKVELDGLRKDRKGAEAAAYLRENPQAMLVPMADRLQREISKLTAAKRDMVKKDFPADRVKLMDERITALMRQLNDRVRKLEAQPA